MDYHPITAYEGIYEINTQGDVNRILTNGKRKPMKIRRSYRNQKIVTLCKKGEKKKYVTIMRLMFNTFAPEHIKNSGKEYDLILTNGNKNDCSFANIEYYEKEKPYLANYEDLSACEKFARDTKYISYYKDFDGRECYIFKRTIDWETFKEVWNVDRVEDNVHYLQSKYKEWLEYLPTKKKL